MKTASRGNRNVTTIFLLLAALWKALTACQHPHVYCFQRPGFSSDSSSLTEQPGRKSKLVLKVLLL